MAHLFTAFPGPLYAARVTSCASGSGRPRDVRKRAFSRPKNGPISLRPGWPIFTPPLTTFVGTSANSVLVQDSTGLHQAEQKSTHRIPDILRALSRSKVFDYGRPAC